MGTTKPAYLLWRFVRSPWGIWALAVVAYAVTRWLFSWPSVIFSVVLLGWFSVLVYLTVMKAWHWLKPRITATAAWRWSESLFTVTAERARAKRRAPDERGADDQPGQPDDISAGTPDTRYRQGPSASRMLRPPPFQFGEPEPTDEYVDPEFGPPSLDNAPRPGNPCDVRSIVNLVSYLLDAEGIEPSPQLSAVALSQAGTAVVTAFGLSPAPGAVPYGVAEVSQRLRGTMVSSVRPRFAPPGIIAGVLYTVLASDDTAVGITADHLELATVSAGELLLAMRIQPLDLDEDLHDWPVMARLLSTLPAAPKIW